MDILKFEQPTVKKSESSEIVLERAKKKQAGYCRHIKVTIDLETRQIICNCGQVLDPFDHLANLAAHQDLSWSRATRLEQEIKDSASRLKDLARQERNAKSRLKRLHKKLE